MNPKKQEGQQSLRYSYYIQLKRGTCILARSQGKVQQWPKAIKGKKGLQGMGRKTKKKENGEEYNIKNRYINNKSHME